MSYLVADIGGTNVRFRLFARAQDGWITTHEERCLAVERSDPAHAIGRFLDSLPADARAAVRGACLAVAGPVRDGRASMTNIDWHFDAKQLAAEFDVEFVDLVNDFEAVALAIPCLPADALRRIRSGHAGNGPALAIGPGTGLGQVMFGRHGGDVAIFPSEGGHVAFAPLDDEQDRLLSFLRARHGRVTYEHLLSGRGLGDIHRFLRGREADPGSDQEAVDQAANVSALARAGDGQARKAVALFWAVLGAFAGDSVLTYLASGGVYLVGGMLPRLPEALGHPEFRAAFEQKGALSSATAEVPVLLVTSGDTGLIGAQAHVERRIAGARASTASRD